MFDASFSRTLSERVGNLREYARKLSGNAVVDIISLDDKITGFAAYYCNDLLSKQAFLTQIAVSDACRGMLIGSKLLELCMETSKQNGMEKIICEVDDASVAALQLYEKHGFTFLKRASDCSQFLERIL
jgi:ribosomal protein S18 acetylase RimI-like enzyme